MATEQEQFIRNWEREFETTIKVLRAYPADKLDLKPSEKSKSARDLLFVFASEHYLFNMALDGNINWTMQPPKVPVTLEEIVRVTEKGHAELVVKLKGMPDAAFEKTVAFPVAPNTMGQVRVMDLSWMLLHDSIHHRGQIS
ncbi:MAG: DinB family protein, partial [Ignavibacteriae bacterium]|nr:DinB family protein [Ignavibacteriota bacterium]